MSFEMFTPAGDEAVGRGARAEAEGGPQAARGGVRQYLRRKADGTWEGWERYDDGRESDVLAVTLAVLPLGYVPVQP